MSCFFDSQCSVAEPSVRIMIKLMIRVRFSFSDRVGI